MISEDSVWTILVESNPIPDVGSLENSDTIEIAAYLATLDERSSEVTQLDDRKTTERPRRSMIGWMVAAMAVILIGVVVILTNQGSGDEVPPATEPAPEPTTTQAPEAAEVNAVLAAIEAFNQGDVEAWLAAFDPDSVEVNATWEFEGETYWFTEVLMSSNSQLFVEDGCEVIEGPPIIVECTIRHQNDWDDRVGLGDAAISQFTLNDQLLITHWEDNWECCAEETAFNRAFWTWLTDAYPEVAADIQPADGASMPGWQRDPADMGTAIQYLDEFMEQSEFYPLQDPGS